MIAWIKRLFGFGKRAESAQPTFSQQYNNKAGGDIVGRDIVVIGGKADAGRSLVMERTVSGVVMSIKGNDNLPKRTKKQKKLSREQRRKQKAAR